MALYILRDNDDYSFVASSSKELKEYWEERLSTRGEHPKPWIRKIRVSLLIEAMLDSFEGHKITIFNSALWAHPTLSQYEKVQGMFGKTQWKKIEK